VRASAIAIALCLLSAGQSSDAASWRGADASIKFTVLDDAGAPVTNAVVVGHFASPYGKDYIGDRFDLRTDTNGQCLVVGRGFTFVSGRVAAPSHYYSSYKVSLGDKELTRKSGKWEVSEHRLVLMRVRHPVPMYAGQITIGPVVRNPGQLIGYDFVVGDWVAPHGKGVHVDMTFQYQKTILRSDRIEIKPRQDDVRGQVARTVEMPLDVDISMKIAMPNPGDGMIKTKQQKIGEMVSDYQAPEDGYQPTVDLFSKQRQEKRHWPGTLESNSDGEALYYIRLRTELDEHGTVKRAWYGKICGELDKAPQYFLNPDGTRNVEFDPSKNLSAGGLVAEP